MADKLFVADNYDVVLPEVDAPRTGKTVDDINYSTKSGATYKIVHDGRVRAVKVKIKFDGTDQTSRINTVLASVDVQELIFDVIGGDCTISGTVTVPTGKHLVFKNGCRIIGSGTIDGGIIECNYRKQCFGTSLTVTNILPADATSPVWFGAKPDYIPGVTGTWTDNQPIFTKALNAIRNAGDGVANQYKGRFYIPHGERTSSGDWTYYKFNSTWDVNACVDIFGDGMDRTCLRIASQTWGMYLRSYDGTTTPVTKGGLKSTVKSLSMTGEGPFIHMGSDFLGKGGGILVAQNNVRIEDVDASTHSGPGVFFNGAGGGSPFPGGNVNNCIAIRVRTWVCGVGMLIDGPDANNITVITHDGSYAQRWGFWDSSFLGCLQIGCHTAANGRANVYNRSAVTWNGTGTGTTGWKEYACITDNGPSTTAGVVEPGVTAGWETVWQYQRDVPTAPFFEADLPNLDAGPRKKWNNTTLWVSGGGTYMDDSNNFGAMIGCYSESGEQVTVLNRSNCLVLGGFAALGGVDTSMTSHGGAMTVAQFKSQKPASVLSANLTSLVALHNVLGTYWGGLDDISGAAFGFFLHPTDKYTSVGTGTSGADDGTQVMKFLHAGTNALYAGYMGLAAIPGLGAIIFPRSVWVARDDAFGNYRRRGSALAAPTTGEHTEGDTWFNSSSTDRTTEGWKCITYGTPGGIIPTNYNEFELTWSTTIAVDANSAHTQFVILTGNATMSSPSNPKPGRRIRFRIYQPISGGKILTWTTGSGGAYRFSSSKPAPTLSTGSGAMDIFDFEYNQRDDRWDCIDYNQGF
jgi:hypothetical protein